MNSQEIRQKVLKLMDQKDKIESEIQELTDILTKNGIGMNDPLVDNEGFPIASIDIYQVRHARHRIICLQNDHKNIMKQIDQGLQEFYSSNPSSSEASAMEIDRSDREIVTHKIPFAKVTTVSPNSPAQLAGIEDNDEIVEFGSVNATNFKNILDIATVVQHSEGRKINLKLKRNERFISTQLLPKRWSGKGLLGCNIVGL